MMGIDVMWYLSIAIGLAMLAVVVWAIISTGDEIHRDQEERELLIKQREAIAHGAGRYVNTPAGIKFQWNDEPTADSEVPK